MGQRTAQHQPDSPNKLEVYQDKQKICSAALANITHWGIALPVQSALTVCQSLEHYDPAEICI